MFELFAPIFRRQTVEDMLNEQLEDARRNAALHEAAAEHHDALALMYHTRVERITAQIACRKGVGNAASEPPALWGRRAA